MQSSDLPSCREDWPSRVRAGISALVLCRACAGSGEVEGEECSRCGGSGIDPSCLVGCVCEEEDCGE